jgi:hypothetical protein
MWLQCVLPKIAANLLTGDDGGMCVCVWVQGGGWVKGGSVGLVWVSKLFYC